MLIILKWYWVLLLLPLPWLVRWLAPAAAVRRSGALLRVPFFAEVAEASGSRPVAPAQRRTGFRLLTWLIWVLLVVAAAQPQHVGDAIDINPEARDLMLAVDISGSMQTQDMRLKGEPASRIDTLKTVAQEFISHREGDRMGLILFGTQAYVQTPLTFDRKALGTLLNEAQIGMAGPNTAIGDAIGLAIKRVQDHPKSARVLVLLTDGASNAGEVSPLQAAELAAEEGLRIYTIGFGADEMTDNGIFGTGFMRRSFNPSADLDEKTLSTIAQTTGGQYFRARNVDELRRIYQLLDRLEPVKMSTETYRPLRNLFHYPLTAALALSALLALASLLRTFRQEKRLHRAAPGSTP